MVALQRALDLSAAPEGAKMGHAGLGSALRKEPGAGGAPWVALGPRGVAPTPLQLCCSPGQPPADGRVTWSSVTNDVRNAEPREWV